MKAAFDSLRDGLVRTLRADYGIQAEVCVLPLRPTKVVRFYAISDDFERLRHAERQNVVWRIVKRFLGADDRRLIGSIVTCTIEEAEDEEDLQKLRKRVK